MDTKALVVIGIGVILGISLWLTIARKIIDKLDVPFVVIFLATILSVTCLALFYESFFQVFTFVLGNVTGFTAAIWKRRAFPDK